MFRVGWSPPRPVGTGLGSAPRRHAAGWPAAAQEPAEPRSPVRASSLHAIPAAGAVYRVEGLGSRDGRSSACERPSAIGKDVTCGYLPCANTCPEGSPVGTFRWSAPDDATPFGAARAGSNPAGGTSHVHKFQRSNDLDATEAQAPDLRRHGSVPNNLVSNPCPQPDAERASSRARQSLTFTPSGCWVTADCCSCAPPAITRR
jgi:hypothetical protein